MQYTTIGRKTRMTNPEYNEMIDPTDCDFCGVEFEYGTGGVVAEEQVCLECFETGEDIV
jgi:hypothetical protein